MKGMMSRLRSAAIAASLMLVLPAAASAQNKQRQTADDRLLRLFARTEAKHQSSRRNLNQILREQPQFWQELRAAAARLKTHPAWLLNVMAAESLFDPDARNPLPGQTASGLLQMIESTARSMGTTAEEIRRMNPIKQLCFVEKYFAPFRGRLNTLADVYTAVFRGSIIEGMDAAIVVDSSKESRVYALNRSLDIDKDGRITKGELGLAALSIGRFLPTPARMTRVKKTRENQAVTAAIENEESQFSTRRNQSLYHAASSSDDRNPERPRQTRSIYVRRKSSAEASMTKRH